MTQVCGSAFFLPGRDSRLEFLKSSQRDAGDDPGGDNEVERRTGVRHFLCLLWKFRKGLLQGAAWHTVIGIYKLPTHTHTHRRPWQSFGCTTHIVLIVSPSSRFTFTFSLALLFFFGPKLIASLPFPPHWLEFLRHDLDYQQPRAGGGGSRDGWRLLIGPDTTYKLCCFLPLIHLPLMKIESRGNEWARMKNRLDAGFFVNVAPVIPAKAELD